MSHIARLLLRISGPSEIARKKREGPLKPKQHKELPAFSGTGQLPHTTKAACTCGLWGFGSFELLYDPCFMSTHRHRTTPEHETSAKNAARTATEDTPRERRLCLGGACICPRTPALDHGGGSQLGSPQLPRGSLVVTG